MWDAHGVSRRWPLRVHDVAGVPVVPPAGLAAVATKVRATLALAHDRMGLPFQVLLERLTGALDAPALYAFVELGVAEHLAKPKRVDDLAALVGAPEDSRD